MDYILFDRHTNMSSETLSKIGKIISDIEINYDRSESFPLVNRLYGLYDGYFYVDLLTVDWGYLTDDEFLRLSEIVNVVEKYPKYLP
jgi:hypothetical protein